MPQVDDEDFDFGDASKDISIQESKQEENDRNVEEQHNEEEINLTVSWNRRL